MTWSDMVLILKSSLFQGGLKTGFHFNYPTYSIPSIFTSFDFLDAFLCGMAVSFVQENARCWLSITETLFSTSMNNSAIEIPQTVNFLDILRNHSL